MAESHSTWLVLDASLARAAGGEAKTDPTSAHCRDFLKHVLSICHRLVMTDEIRDEWKRHESTFARTWRTALTARGKVTFIDAPADRTLRDRVEACFEDHATRQAAWKDCCLLEAALASQMRIGSLDEKARDAFARAARHVPEIAEVVWVNPAKSEDNALNWLVQGAPQDIARQLRRHGRDRTR